MPSDRGPKGSVSTVRDLIAACVEDELRDRSNLLRAQSKVLVFCGEFAPPSKRLNLQVAQESAWQAFEAGANEVILDGRPLRTLDETISVSFDSDLIFLPRRRIQGL